MGSGQDSGAYSGLRRRPWFRKNSLSDGCHSQCPGRLQLVVGRGLQCWPHLCAPLDNDILLLWRPRLPLQTFLLCSSLLLRLQAFSLPTAVPSLGPHSKPHSPAPFRPPQPETHYSDGHAQGGDTDHERCSYIVQLPQTVCCIPFNPLQVSLYPI